ncbi:hypothetical protein LQ567_14620 [Niabella pedocola]|uniref:Uncharacterized protein n=1 Tax=Niabella pedocola TaxID=1752077 RepID=A0ABS8PT62_9BACT|nr:hypothetical protein [Niabella pedocola]MCD2424009.1 hypothetical protein [Niabella pedocola]
MITILNTLLSATAVPIRNHILYKQITSFLLLLLIFCTAYGQSGHSYKQLQGRYGGTSDGIYLFEDSTFLLYGYATMVFGKYTLEKELLLFYPDKPDQVFSVYARNDTAIKGIRLAFGGFERGHTFIRFDEAPVKRVFNEHANCFSAPFVYDTVYHPQQIMLSHQLDAPWRLPQTGKEPGGFLLPVKANDYILVYHQPDRYHDPFRGCIVTQEGVLLLATTLTSRQFAKQEEAPDQLREVIQLKADYKQSRGSETVMYTNDRYRPFEEPDTAAYTYDAASNQYISNQVFDKKKDYNRHKSSDYHDDGVLRKYTRVTLQAIDKNDAEAPTDPRSLFYTTCEEPEKSYKYKGIPEIPVTDKAPLTPAPAAPVLTD